MSSILPSTLDQDAVEPFELSGRAVGGPASAVLIRATHNVLRE